MSTKTRTKPKSAAELMEWLGKAPEEDAAPKEKKEPAKAVWHAICPDCYPQRYSGPAIGVCGVKCGGVGKVAMLARGPEPDDCPECALILHRTPDAPCPRADCPRRSWIGRAWRRWRG